MATSNLGRVQGGGFFGSTSTSTTSIAKSTVPVGAVSPLVGDTIVNANGELCKITAVESSAYAVVKYGSIRDEDGAPAYAVESEQTRDCVKGSPLDRRLKKIEKALFN